MKNIPYCILISVMILLLISCKKDQPIGKWKDNIKLSQKAATLNANLNSMTINTESTSWWLNNIMLNKVDVDLSTVKKTDKNFVVNHTDFRVERINGNTIVITMNRNITGFDRLLTIGLQNGNYFDGIAITQQK
ncbi:hypothetical protein ASE92_11340 [Pedobacter sp. Leaf41]|nr:hypothetical protein ASE92_11340 [Pedobacter sp. Leaf41]